jgi:hypothetical protein
MYQQDDILIELQLLSPTLAQVPRVNVFSVPEGYFELLSGQLLSLIYTDNLDRAPLAGSAVPAGYFENLADAIMARIKKEYQTEVVIETQAISGIVAEIGNKNIYSVPQGYFEGLSQAIADKRKSRMWSEAAEETNHISELVAGIGNTNIFKVPQGYFNELPDQIKSRVTASAKVITMKSRFSTFRYAAAAVVTGLIGLSLFLMLNKSGDSTKPTVQTAAVMSEANQIIKTNSFDKEFSSVTDAAIVSFLESKGQDVEAALVASLTDEKNLPDADDYLINENTLDEVLKTLDLNN